MSDLNELALLGSVLIGIGFCFTVSAYGIYRRHAVPKRPFVYALLTVPTSLGVAAASFLLGGAFLSGSPSALGVATVPLAVVFAVCLLVREGALDVYALHNYLRESGGEGRRTADERRDRADERREQADERRKEVDKLRQDADDARSRGGGT